MIVGLLSLHVAAVLVMVWVATRDRSFAVEPDYYQKALHWDDSQQQERDNQRLAWQVTIDIDPQKSDLGDQNVICRLSDKAGRPLEEAFIDLVAFSHARGNQRLTTIFAEDAPGRYRGFLRFRRPGLWEFRMVIHHGHDVFTYNQQRQVE